MNERLMGVHTTDGFRPDLATKPLSELSRLDKDRRKEQGNKAIDKAIAELAQRANEHTEDSFVKPDGSLSYKKFRDIYPSQEIQDDKKHIESLEMNRARVDDPKIRQLFIKRYERLCIGKSEDDITNLMLAERERFKEQSYRTEILATLLLDKVLGDRYTIVRTTEYDDNYAGVDTLIVDRESGEVIGAFDDAGNDGMKNRITQKNAKIVSMATKSDSEIKYGFTFENGVMVKKRLKNIPVFYVPLTTPDSEAIIDSLIKNGGRTLSAAEREIFNKIVVALKMQIELLLAAPIKEKLRPKIQQFKTTISTWKA